ncbi:MAG: carbohydrate kinase family protein [Candidatus Pacebacteria bacterium]|nr:carbohydrate kinase family protein [Candidatus Paceibacterota bacterium]
MFDIITFGSASWDIFLKPKRVQTVKSNKFIANKGVCFNLGSKIDIEELNVYSGGGGTNTAATFANQGFKTAFSGMIGDDIGGREMTEELKNRNIDTSLVVKTKLRPTNHSFIVIIPNEDRTILVYRGASELLCKGNIDWTKLKAEWFYLAPLSGSLCNISRDLVDFAYKNKIKVAFNPGNSQLIMPSKTLKNIFKHVNILILNQEEASLLTKIPYTKEKEIFKKIDELCPGVFIMTKGSKGAVVSDGSFIYRADSLKTEVIDRTGAGDSFASGFVSGYIRSKSDIKYAIQLGTANSAYCLTKYGAKNALLKKSDKFKKVKVIKELCSKNNSCQIKNYES